MREANRSTRSGWGERRSISVPPTPAWDKMPPPRKNGSMAPSNSGMATAHDTSLFRPCGSASHSSSVFEEAKTGWKIGTPSSRKTHTLSRAGESSPTNAGMFPPLLVKYGKNLTRAPIRLPLSPRKTSRDQIVAPLLPVALSRSVFVKAGNTPKPFASRAWTSAASTSGMSLTQ